MRTMTHLLRRLRRQPMAARHSSLFLIVGICTGIVLLSGTAAAEPLELNGGLLLHYNGRLAPEGSQDAGQAVDWYVLAVPTTVDANHASGWSWLWVLEEAGRGGWDWTRRFGIVTGAPGELATLQFEHDSGTYVIRLPSHWQDDSKWKVGTQWNSPAENLEYRVEGRESRRGHDCWKVVARSPIGVKRTLWIHPQTGLLVDLQERVFMGRGEKYSLTLALSGSTILEDEAVTNAWRAAHQLDQLRSVLGKRQDEGSVPWTAEQLREFASFDFPSEVAWAPLRRLIQDAERDRRQHANQSDSLADMEKKAIGRDVRDLKFRDAASQVVDFESLSKGVTVLHFWEYRDTPLRPPYGQVGFLDFVSRKQEPGKVQVVGVVVHRPVESPAARLGIVRSAKKLAQFMNLSYPLVYDDGEALREIGDPRQLGVSLPLYVVVDANGRIAAVHAGLYATDPQVGLRELEGHIAKALQNGNTVGE